VDSTSILDVVLRIFQGLLTPVIAIIAVYIAYQQHKTNRDKLRLDLYNKRYEVFHSLMTLLARILQQGNVKDEQVTEFSRATKEAVFLFDEGISTYLETIRKKALDLWATEENMKPLPVGKERTAKVAEVRELCDWFTKQFEVAIDKFNKYLKFKQKLKVKAMNWERGFKRLTWILSVIVGLLCCVWPCWVYYHDTFIVAEGKFRFEHIGSLVLPCLLCFAIGWSFVWVVYGITRWGIIPIVLWGTKGFEATSQKVSKNNK